MRCSPIVGCRFRPKDALKLSAARQSEYDVPSRSVELSIEMNAKNAPLAAQRAESTIQFQNVTYSVKGSNPEVSALAIVGAISLEIARGETLVLLGRSGSGKTTLLRLINRLLIPTSGRVLVQGRATSEWDPIRLRRGIGYVIQEAGLFPHFTVAQNIALVPTLEGWEPSRIASRVAELLALVGLDPHEFGERRPQALSGGQRQRVGVARALAGDPPILLMDEPFGALDPVTRAELQREFRALASRLGKTIVFVTHDLREALLLGSRIVLLQAGRIVASALPQEFLHLDHPEVRAFASSLAPVSGARA
jgi:osmoprotectant transport system ATP-binding protein